jgi:pimeloyl-ACP methyl ester carboxylesterase
MVRYRTATVDGRNVFYRESGDAEDPNLLLLHGFPSSSHMFRNLIPLLADRFHIVAPDLPGFGFSDAPDRAEFGYTFDNLAKVIEGFTDAIGLSRYAIYVFDYGAPVGFRLALARPERVTAIISQNGNAYEEGLSTGWNPIQKYWQEPNAANRQALRAFLTPETTKWQYLHGVPDETLVAPESHALDSALLARPGNDEIQLDLFLDYASNVALYPKFQEYFRTKRPPLLAVWGRNDPFFLPPRRGSLSPRQSQRRSAFLRYRPLRPRNPCPADRDRHSSFPVAVPRHGSSPGVSGHGLSPREHPAPFERRVARRRARPTMAAAMVDGRGEAHWSKRPGFAASIRCSTRSSTLEAGSIGRRCARRSTTAWRAGRMASRRWGSAPR